MTRKATDYIVVHCSATRADMDLGVTEITAWHRHHGWNTIGYHFVIRRNGHLETGRQIDAIGAHVKGFNHNSIGICLVGGLGNDKEPENNFTPEQWHTLHGLLHRLRGEYPTAQILGHRDFSPDLDQDGVIEQHEWMKACPCFDVRGWLEKNAPELVLIDE